MNRFKIFLISILFCLFLVPAFALADNVNVHLTIPGSVTPPPSGGGGGGGGGTIPPQVTTSTDHVAPNITEIRITPLVNGAQIDWRTSEPADSQMNYGISPSYGLHLYEERLLENHSFSIGNLLPNLSYHFRLIATDAAGNAFATGDLVFKTLPDKTSPADVSNLALTPKGQDFSLTWTNPADLDFLSVKVLRKAGMPSQNPSDGALVYTGNGQNFIDRAISKNIDYYYTVFSFDTSGNNSGGTFVHGRLLSGVTITTSTTPGGTVPQNPTSSVPVNISLKLEQFHFFIGNGQIETMPVNGEITNLTGGSFAISISKNILPLKAKNIEFDFGSEKHLFALRGNEYTTNVNFPGVGLQKAFIVLNYEDGRRDAIPLFLNSLPLGEIFNGATLVSDAELTLLNGNGFKIDGGKYGFQNPGISKDGYYGFVVPNGDYQLIIKKTGFVDRSISLKVDNNIINAHYIILPAPENVIGKITPKLRNASEVAMSLYTGFISAMQNIKYEELIAALIALIVIIAIFFSIGALVSWANILPLLRLLFIQPFISSGSRRQREGWGQVYDSLSKMPVDLATVRLVSKTTGRVVQSKVTDAQGRYAFVANPGTYVIEVVRAGFVFPSVLLKDAQTDGEKPDLYHGEIINVSEENAIITANIPLDHIGAHERPFKFILKNSSYYLRWVIIIFGIIITLLSQLLNYHLYMWGLLVVQVAALILLYILAKPKNVKSWGVVYDIETAKPVERVVARLYNAGFNRLVASQVTDSRGRYYFLAGDDEYYVTFEHPEYQTEKTDILNLKGQAAVNIAIDIGMKKNSSNQVQNQPQNLSAKI